MLQCFTCTLSPSTGATVLDLLWVNWQSRPLLQLWSNLQGCTPCLPPDSTLLLILQVAFVTIENCVSPNCTSGQTAWVQTSSSVCRAPPPSRRPPAPTPSENKTLEGNVYTREETEGTLTNSRSLTLLWFCLIFSCLTIGIPPLRSWSTFGCSSHPHKIWNTLWNVTRTNFFIQKSFQGLRWLVFIQIHGGFEPDCCPDALERSNVPSRHFNTNC